MFIKNIVYRGKGLKLKKIKEFFNLKNIDLGNINVPLIVYAVLATVIGIVVIGSAEKSVQSSQIVGLILGLIVMSVFAIFDYKTIIKYYWVLYIVSIVLLFAVVLFGSSSGGAERWLSLGPIRFQPSEIVKIFLIIFFGEFFKEHKYDLNKPKTLLLSAGLIAVPLALILVQPDLSTTIVTFLVFLTIIFVANLSKRLILTGLAIILPIAVISMIFITKPNQGIIRGYQQKRILAWLDPEKYADSDAMQQQNSIMAIGSGQATGKGLNNNKVASMKNGNFVPEPQTDFIFAVVGEELGFIGTATVIILILKIVLKCIYIGRKCNETSGKLICIGIGSLIGFQAFVNLSVATGLFPNTGVTLPFISYGVTSLVSLYVGIGVVLNIGMQQNQYNKQKVYI